MQRRLLVLGVVLLVVPPVFEQTQFAQTLFAQTVPGVTQSYPKPTEPQELVAPPQVEEPPAPVTPVITRAITNKRKPHTNTYRSKPRPVPKVVSPQPKQEPKYAAAPTSALYQDEPSTPFFPEPAFDENKYKDPKTAKPTYATMRKLYAVASLQQNPVSSMGFFLTMAPILPAVYSGSSTMSDGELFAYGLNFGVYLHMAFPWVKAPGAQASFDTLLAIGGGADQWFNSMYGFGASLMGDDMVTSVGGYGSLAYSGVLYPDKLAFGLGMYIHMDLANGVSVLTTIGFDSQQALDIGIGIGGRI